MLPLPSNNVTRARSEISLTNSLFANSGSSTGRPIVVSGIKPSLGLAEVRCVQCGVCEVFVRCL